MDRYFTLHEGEKADCRICPQYAVRYADIPGLSITSFPRTEVDGDQVVIAGHLVQVDDERRIFGAMRLGERFPLHGEYAGYDRRFKADDYTDGRLRDSMVNPLPPRLPDTR